MKIFTKLLSTSTLIASLLSPLVVMANEEENTENIRDGAYLDVGIGLKYQSDPFTYDNENDSGLDVFINGRYQKNGWFVEFPHGTSQQQNTIISIGYNFLKVIYIGCLFKLLSI